MTLQQILNYANVLAEDQFDNLSSIIDFLNEAQEIIARWEPVQASPVEYELTTNEVTLPDDFLQVYKVTLDDVPYNLPEEPWDGVITLPEGLDSGTLKLWYYKSPAPLLATTPTQVPEVKPVYHRAMASYATKMFHLIDDDPSLKDQFNAEFANQVAGMKVSTGVVTNYRNLW